MSDLRDQAAREFVKGAISRVPVYEGTARATFIPLGRLVNMMITIGSVKTPPRAGRGVSAGASMASAKRTGNQYVRSFTWEHSVLHFALSDTMLRNKSAPWYAVQAGRAAAIAYLKQHAIKNIPSPISFITRSSL
jgi:hypothetical protein